MLAPARTEREGLAGGTCRRCEQGRKTCRLSDFQLRTDSFSVAGSPPRRKPTSSRRTALSPESALFFQQLHECVSPESLQRGCKRLASPMHDARRDIRGPADPGWLLREEGPRTAIAWFSKRRPADRRRIRADLPKRTRRRARPRLLAQCRRSRLAGSSAGDSSLLARRALAASDPHTPRRAHRQESLRARLGIG
jgi:hypothetical protein